MVNLTAFIAIAVALRIGFFAFGLYQDAHMPVKYTDIDYLVFSDASKYVYNGTSPYMRETYRYTPVLAWLLLPNNWSGVWCHYGKVVFILGDLVTGYIITKLLSQLKLNQRKITEKRKLIYASIWLLNPMVITISTRGSSESVLTSMIMMSLYYLLSTSNENLVVSAIWLGIAIHFKIYPVIYLPSILYYLSDKVETPLVGISSLKLNWKNITFLLVTCASFSTLTALMYLIYGQEFLDETYLYHLTRLDHRHNFSIYNVLLYYKSAVLGSSPLSTGYDIEKLAFIPQLVISGIIIPLLLAKQDLISCLFIQTFVFVAFNKVITSQYFIWFLIFLPHFLTRSNLATTRKTRGAIILLLWIGSQACWLYNAYRLEFLGENTFDYALLYSAVFFFLSNCICIREFIASV